MDGGGVSVLANEVHDPSEEEIREYAEFLGIDIDKEPYLEWIAREGVSAPVPHPWKACTENGEDVFYFNFETAESVWDHPCDEKYRQLAEDCRRKYQEDLTNNKKESGDPGPRSGQASARVDSDEDEDAVRGPEGAVRHPMDIAACGLLETVDEVSEEELSCDKADDVTNTSNISFDVKSERGSVAAKDAGVGSKVGDTTLTSSPEVAPDKAKSGMNSLAAKDGSSNSSREGSKERSDSDANDGAARSSLTRQKTGQRDPLDLSGSGGVCTSTESIPDKPLDKNKAVDKKLPPLSSPNGKAVVDIGALKARLEPITNEISDESPAASDHEAESSKNSKTPNEANGTAKGVGIGHRFEPRSRGLGASKSDSIADEKADLAAHSASSEGSEVRRRSNEMNDLAGRSGDSFLSSPSGMEGTFDRGLAGVGLATPTGTLDVAVEQSLPSGGRPHEDSYDDEFNGSLDSSEASMPATASVSASASASMSASTSGVRPPLQPTSGSTSLTVPTVKLTSSAVDRDVGSGASGTGTSTGPAATAQVLLNGGSRKPSTSNVSEVSEELMSEFDVTSPASSQQGGRQGDSLEFSASAATFAEAVLPASTAQGPSLPQRHEAPAVSSKEASKQQAALSATTFADATRWRRVESQVQSLTRSLAMLRDIRAKQQEYLRLLSTDML